MGAVALRGERRASMNDVRQTYARRRNTKNEIRDNARLLDMELHIPRAPLSGQVRQSGKAPNTELRETVFKMLHWGFDRFSQRDGVSTGQ